MYGRLADSDRAVRQAREARRIPNTHPTLPLERYAGTYADSLYGTAIVTAGDSGRLTLQLGTLQARLQPWQYDVFRATWSDPFIPAEFVSFAIDPDGTVGALQVVDGEQLYHRVR